MVVYPPLGAGTDPELVLVEVVVDVVVGMVVQVVVEVIVGPRSR